MKQYPTIPSRDLVQDDNNRLTVDRIQSYLASAMAAIDQQAYSEALTQLLEAKALSQSAQLKPFIAECLLYIGILYSNVSHYTRAISAFQEIQDQYLIVIRNPAIKSKFYNAWGKALFHRNQFEAAKTQFEEAKSIATIQKDKRSLIISLVHLSAIYTIHKQFKKALMVAKRANDYIETIPEDVDGLPINLINLGNIHYQLGKYSEGIKLTSRGIAAAKRLKDEISEIKGYKVMSAIFQKQKDYKNALLYQTIYAKFFEDFFLRNERQVLSDIEHTFVLKTLIG